MAGRLIVLEGTDGSGKSTQFSLLCGRMDREGRPFRKLIFPQYQEPSSALVERTSAESRTAPARRSMSRRTEPSGSSSTARRQ